MERPKYMGVADFAERLAERLADARLHPAYRNQDALRRDVAAQVKEFVDAHLSPLGVPFSIWQQGVSLPSDLDPVEAFGRDFWPDVAVEVAEVPTLALVMSLISPKDAGHRPLGSLLGQALIHTRLYPAVLAFALDKGPADEHKHWWDPELRGELRDRYKIRLVIRR